jgi:hypothetical protein
MQKEDEVVKLVMVLRVTSVASLIMNKPCTISSFITNKLHSVTKLSTNKPLSCTPILYRLTYINSYRIFGQISIVSLAGFFFATMSRLIHGSTIPTVT